MKPIDIIITSSIVVTIITALAYLFLFYKINKKKGNLEVKSNVNWELTYVNCKTCDHSFKAMLPEDPSGITCPQCWSEIQIYNTRSTA